MVGMSTTLRGLRCTQETYQIVAWYAGREGLSLCESLDQLVKTSSLVQTGAPVADGTAEPEGDPTPDPWAGWEGFFSEDKPTR